MSAEERWMHSYAEHLQLWGGGGGAGRASQPAIHKSPTVSQVRQKGRVSNQPL